MYRGLARPPTHMVYFTAFAAFVMMPGNDTPGYALRTVSVCSVFTLFLLFFPS